ncbi:MAG: arylsulfotransferase family protein [Solirubrobacterales bacterium]
MRSLAIVLGSFVLLLAGVRTDIGVSAAQQQDGKGAKESVYDPRRFASRPDLRPPKINVTKPPRRAAPGYFFFSVRVRKGTPDQYGPMIADERGEVIWFNPRNITFSSNLHAINYMGRPALTWWEGRIFPGYGRGDWIVVDRSYKQIAQIKGGNGQQTDFHDVRFTDRTVIVMNFVTVNRDLSAFGGAPNTNVLDNVVQEIDLKTGKVLFQWSALDHVALSESSRPPPTEAGKPYDFFHMNSLDIDKDGHLLIGARRTNSVFKVHRKTGAVIWRLGGRCSTFETGPGTEFIDLRLAGRCSTFEMGPGTEFIAQHDARRNVDGSITIFDNGQRSKGYTRSRGISLRLDTNKREARLRRTYRNPVDKLSRLQGNFQPLSNGRFLAGWGNLPNYTEFDRSGRLIYNAELPQGVNSYRVYKMRWSGRPAEEPAIAVRELSQESLRVYASWNGATGVATWQVLAGSSRGNLEPVRTERKRGFETRIDLRTRARYFQVRARSQRGRTLGASKIARR